MNPGPTLRINEAFKAYFVLKNFCNSTGAGLNIYKSLEEIQNFLLQKKNYAAVNFEIVDTSFFNQLEAIEPSQTPNVIPIKTILSDYASGRTFDLVQSSCTTQKEP